MRYLLPVLVLAACGGAPLNVGVEQLSEDAAPPPPYDLDLWSSPWIPGAPLQVHVRRALPGSTVQVRLGQPGRTCAPALGGACLDLGGVPAVVGSAVAGADGVAVVAITLPAGAPVGLVRVMQAVGGIGGGGPAAISNPWASEVVAGCPGAAGCNLISNGGVDADTVPFREFLPYATASWGRWDRTGDPASGSLEVTNNTPGAYSSVFQCAAVQPGQVLNYRAFGYLPAASAGSAMFAEYLFYSGRNCDGGLLSFAEAPWEVGLQTWTTLELVGFVAPPGARSVRVGHGAVALAGAAAEAYFDDFELRAR